MGGRSPLGCLVRLWGVLGWSVRGVGAPLARSCPLTCWADTDARVRLLPHPFAVVRRFGGSGLLVGVPPPFGCAVGGRSPLGCLVRLWGVLGWSDLMLMLGFGQMSAQAREVARPGGGRGVPMSSAGHQKPARSRMGRVAGAVTFGRLVGFWAGFLEPYTNRLQKKMRFLADKKNGLICRTLLCYLIVNSTSSDNAQFCCNSARASHPFGPSRSTPQPPIHCESAADPSRASRRSTSGQPLDPL